MKFFLEEGQQNMPCWSGPRTMGELVAYWQQQDMQEKDDHMVETKGVVANVSHLGQGGKATARAKLICVF
jgi:hypothetical protein